MSHTGKTTAEKILPNRIAKGALSQGFGQCTAGFDQSFDIYSAAPDASQSPNNGQGTVLRSLAGNFNLTVSASSITSVDSTKGGSMGAAQNVQKQTKAVTQQTSMVKGICTNLIQQAQREVHACMKEEGMSGQPLFVQSTSSNVDLFAGAALGGMSSEMLNLLGACQNIKSVSGAERKAMMDQLKDALITRSSPSPQVSLTQKSNDQSEPQTFNWKEFFDNGFELDDIMNVDPNYPLPRELYKEFHDANDMEIRMKQEFANAVQAEERAMKDPNRDPAYFARSTAASLASINQITVPDAQLDARTVAAVNKLNPPLEWAKAASPNNAMGMNA